LAERVFAFGYWFESTSNGNMYWLQRKEVKADTVNYFAPRLPPGTQTLTYTCIVVTPGTFTIPPAKIYSIAQPEVLGLSPGASLKVYINTLRREKWFGAKDSKH
jgi:uncharacterized protein YfaS (alpha-2-macroglobulin family)